MKLKAKLMMFTAAAALTGTMAFAAIDGQQLAESYRAEGYSFVEVKVGLTQTKVEAINGSTKVEVIYDNETGAILKQEQETADAEDRARTGTEVRNVNGDFEDNGDDDNGDDDNGDDDNGDDDSNDDDGSDDSDDDNSGSGSSDGGSDDDGGDD